MPSGAQLAASRAVEPGGAGADEPARRCDPRRFGRDPEQMVNWAMGATKTDFARFAPLVFEHAAKGDPLGVALMEAAGHISA